MPYNSQNLAILLSWQRMCFIIAMSIHVFFAVFDINELERKMHLATHVKGEQNAIRNNFSTHQITS